MKKYGEWKMRKTKKYPNFEKYFNTNLKLWSGIMKVLLVLLIVGVLIVGIKTGEITNLYTDESSYILIVYVIVASLISRIIRNKKSCSFANTRMGKDLQMRGYDAMQVIDRIEAELSSPDFAQIHAGINASANFIITKNWIIGCDEYITMTANAVNVAEVRAVEIDSFKTYSYGQMTNAMSSKHYCTLKIIDKNNRCFNFFMLNNECQAAAYTFVMNNILN